MKNAPRRIFQDYERFVSRGVAPAAGRTVLKRFKSLAGPECQIQTDFLLPRACRNDILERVYSSLG